MKYATTILIFTPFSNRVSSLLRQITGRIKIMYGRYDRSSYFISYFEGKNDRYRIVLKDTGVDHLKAFKLIDATITEHAPKLIFYIGVCESSAADTNPGEILIRQIEGNPDNGPTNEMHQNSFDEVAATFAQTMSAKHSITALNAFLVTEKQVQSRLEELTPQISIEGAVAKVFEQL